jgi:hypothetical protein
MREFRERRKKRLKIIPIRGRHWLPQAGDSPKPFTPEREAALFELD